MDQTRSQGTSVLMEVSNAMVKLHKEQFGRGPTNARTYFAGPDALLCVLDDVLLPAERKMVDLGQQERVRESRTAFQAATAADFVTAVETILDRKVRSFASGVDPDSNVVFESFWFAPSDSGSDGHGTLPAERTAELREQPQAGM